MPTDDQVSICNEYGSRVSAPLLDSKVGIAISTLNQVPLTAIRHKAENGTCGWYIWGGEYSTAPNFFQPLHVEHLINYCPAIIPYLALEPGWGVILAPDHKDIWFDQGYINN